MDKGGRDLDEWKDPSSVPPYGWKVRCDYKFPQKRKQAVEPTFHQMRVLLPLVLRYIWYSIKTYFAGRKPCMDFYTLVQNKKKSGVTLGGIGAGCIGRGFKGEFCRFHMDPGNYKYEDIVADQFIATIYNEEGHSVYQKVLSTYHKSCFLGALRKWDWSFPPQDAHYTALYPRAWYTYEIKDPARDIDIKLTCHQISPIIPHNYKDSCLPVSVFEWSVENNSTKTWQVSITMTMRDGDGTHHCTRKSIKSSEKFEEAHGEGSVLGVTIKQQIAAMPCHYSIAALQNDDTIVQRCLYFDPSSDGKTFWEAIPSEKFEKFSCGSGKRDLGCAVKSKVKLTGLSNSSAIRFVLAWDMPKVNFAHSPNQHLRFYTQFFGCNADAGPKICLYAIENYKRWISEIHSWQEPVLSDNNLPDWYKSALFNELYYVADGGTVWFLLDNEDAEKLPEDDPRKVYGRFGYLEGHEYKMYNTYDVHFYASFALAMLWPGLQKSVQYDFKDSISFEDPTPIWYLYDGAIAPRKVKDSVPHDLGEPDDDPFKIINIYPVHDVSAWKDLNTKFVLQVYRDFVLTEDLNYLRDMYPQVLIVMNTSLKWDSEKLGVIQNSGFPDQTYDTWVMQGVSAYCGGLFLAATKVTIEMAKKMGDDANRDKFEDVLKRGKKAFDDKLWNGKYYNFDSSGADGFDTIMSDQLCGLWYLNACKIKDEIFVESHVTSALNTIYNFNVKQYYDGAQGALNGMKPNGKPCRAATQSEESWTGVTYALASLLISEGMVEEGFSTAKGLYETIFDKAGLGFASPEALHGLDTYRAVGYMRPLSIWSIQHSLDIRKGSSASRT